MKYIIHTDGGARGNPGPSGIGIVITAEDGSVVKEVGEYIGKATNNQAEYQALVRGLGIAKKLGASEIKICMDSELVVKQIQGLYRVKNKELAPLFLKAEALLKNFAAYTITHIPRARNARADELVNEVLDRQQA